MTRALAALVLLLGCEAPAVSPTAPAPPVDSPPIVAPPVVAPPPAAPQAAASVAAASPAAAPQAAAAQAALRLPRLFADHMVLQAGQPISVWGWAASGEAVSVTLDGTAAATRADAAGRFRAELPALAPGGPFELVVTGAEGRELRLSDVLVGEVWVCAGGSNMAWPMRLSKCDDADEAAARDGALRLAVVAEQEAPSPADDLPLTWQPCSRAAVAEFSAAAFVFGRRLREQLDVPVGLVSVTVAFARVEPWIPAASLARAPALAALQEQTEREQSDYRRQLSETLPALTGWLAASRSALASGRAVPERPACPVDPLRSRDAPTALWNGMVAPLATLPIAGVAWYQGEQNVGDGVRYGDKLSALIDGWRAGWSRDDLPFVLVQLAPFRYGQHRPTEKAPAATNPFRLPELWEAQASALRLPATGLVVTTDLADLDDMFVADKRGVSQRLADWALAEVYGRQGIQAASPRCAGVAVEGDCLRLRFADTAGGLGTRDGQPPSWFEVAGQDGPWRRAAAVLAGDDVLVCHPGIPAPRQVRFAWHQECTPNLVGGTGLPATPFRATVAP